MVSNSETYNQLLQEPQSLSNNDISDLKSVIHDFPYFQSARALYLKGLKNADSFRYNHELKITAAHTTDRAVLFDFITSEVFNQKKTIHEELNEKISEEKLINQSPEEVELEVGKPIQAKRY